MNVFLQTSQERVFLCPCTGAHLGWPQGRRAGTLSWLWPLGEMCWAEFWDWLYLSRCFLKCSIKKFPGNWTRCALNASTPWRMYIWNLVGFSVLWLLFSLESSCKPEQNWCTLTDLRSKWGFVIHNYFSRRGCGKESFMFALIPRCLVGERCSCINWWNQTKLRICLTHPQMRNSYLWP